MEKSLDKKLADIRANPGSRAFILADAKDADMAFGIASPGPASPEADHNFQYRSLDEFRQAIRDITAQGFVDIMLMSASTSELLTMKERIFDDSHVTPAVRANDTSDIHIVQGGHYHESPSQPFRTATIDHIQCGKQECAPEERVRGANLGLYSITFNNDLERDLASLNAFKEFRLEAEAKGFRYFLEIFSPNMPNVVPAEMLGRFVNDSVARSLAGVTERGRPLFLKMAFLGPKAMEELVHYDPNLVPGVLGGSAGTTYDAFKLISEAQKYGARAALFGRKINNAEHQLAFVHMLRMIVDGKITSEEAVRAYHGVLQELHIQPKRSPADDMQLLDPALGYLSGKGPATISGYSTPPASTSSLTGIPTAGVSTASIDEPDFDSMTPEEKIDWGLKKRTQTMG
jgi:hypothetical protein